MRRATLVCLVAAGVAGTHGLAMAAGAPRTCEQADPARPTQLLPSKVAALALLGSVTRFLAPLGKPVLATDFATTLAINNQATPALRAQALIDAEITDANAYTLADGLGARMAAIYRREAVFTSADGGRTVRVGQVGPSVEALIKSVNKASGSDSGEAKCAFANGVQPYEGGLYRLPPDGTYDVLGKAYGHPAGSKGADRFGNSRPFQTAPFDAASGPRIAAYVDPDFFGVSLDSRVVLVGPGPGDPIAPAAVPLVDSPSFPSGHTTFGYTEALLLAMMVPERYRALAYRGSEYGNSRIVVGAHYALDVIGGRTLATYDLAQDFAGTPGYAEVPVLSFRAAFLAAARELRGHLAAGGCPIIAECATDPIARAANASVETGTGAKPATPGAAYAYRLTYGLATIGKPDLPPDPVPAEAATLLESRFPYLTAAQRRDVLLTTEGPSGRFLDAGPLTGGPLAAGVPGPQAQAGVYSRLDLFAAAGGYAAFHDQVTVDQDAAAIEATDLRDFADLARVDTWSNDIAGPGGLTKRGAGVLILSGANTYDGPTTVEGGVLEVTGSIRSPASVAENSVLAGAGRLGDVNVAPRGALSAGARDGRAGADIGGALVMAPASRFFVKTADHPARVAGKAVIGGVQLLVAPRVSLHPGTRYLVLEAAGGIEGRFADVTVGDLALRPTLSYEPGAVYLTVEPAGATSTAN